MLTGIPESVAIRTRGLARRFGNRWVLENMDLDIPARSAWMITGANGSGKTTLLRVLSTAIRPHRGTLLIAGQDPVKESDAIRRKLGLVSHATRLYEELGPRDNLAVWASLAGLKPNYEQLLAEVGLSQVPEQPVRTFSAGMRRRLAFALIRLKQPEILLLDEPFAALDPEGRQLIARLIAAERARGTTLVIATHLPEITGPLCDHAIHLEHGLMSWSGHPADAPLLKPEELL